MATDVRVIDIGNLARSLRRWRDEARRPHDAFDAHPVTVGCVDGRQTFSRWGRTRRERLGLAASADRGVTILATVVPDLFRDVDSSHTKHRPMPSTVRQWAAGNGPIEP
jgi:uncharacterized protein YjiS (DUF1127 family)